jgi:hypothetical protein
MTVRSLIDIRSRFLGAAGGVSLAVLLCVTSCVALACLAVPAFAAETAAPRIESISWGVGGHLTLGAEIDPEGLETTYELVLKCDPEASSPCELQPSPQSGGGHLVAGYETQRVEFALTPPKSGGSFWFSVRAVNSAGATYRQTTITVAAEPLGACPSGCSPGEPEETIVPPWIKAVNERESVQTLKEYEEKQRQIAKEHEEQQAKEKARVAEEARAPICSVPSLRGDTVARARSALEKAHCRLGRIIRRSHRRGVLHVVEQNPGPGSRLQAGTSIEIVCRPERRHPRHRR